MLRRWILITAFTVVAYLAASIAWSAVQARPPVQPVGDQPGPLIVVSAPGLTFDDTPQARTSALWDLAREGAVGPFVLPDGDELRGGEAVVLADEPADEGCRAAAPLARQATIPCRTMSPRRAAIAKAFPFARRWARRRRSGPSVAGYRSISFPAW